MMSITQPTRITRNKKRVDYYALEHPKLPRAEKTKDKLYTIKITASKSLDSTVMHKWKKADKIITQPNSRKSKQKKRQLSDSETSMQSLELSVKIKAALNASRRQNPKIRIKIACSQEWFHSCLKSRGMFKKREKGHMIYTIQNYSSLNDLLGHNWHYSGINNEGDFSFVVLSSVEFYLYHGKE